MIKRVHPDILSVQFIDGSHIQKVRKPAVVIGVVVRGHHRVEVDLLQAVVLCEFPVDEVGGVFTAGLTGSFIAAVDHDVPVVGGADQNAVALAYVDEVYFQERLIAERRIAHEAVFAASAHLRAERSCF